MALIPPVAQSRLVRKQFRRTLTLDFSRQYRQVLVNKRLRKFLLSVTVKR